MGASTTLLQCFLGLFAVLFSSLILLLKNPVHASLSFLMTLLFLSGLYISLDAEFIAVLQILVYAGAILVIFMFVIVLFQDAHGDIEKYKAKCRPSFLLLAAAFLTLAFSIFCFKLLGIDISNHIPFEGYGSVQALGKMLYLDFFFPFEAVIFLFLIAIVGALYIAKRTV